MTSVIDESPATTSAAPAPIAPAGAPAAPARLTKWLLVGTLAAAAVRVSDAGSDGPGAPAAVATTTAPSRADPAAVGRYDALFGAQDKQVASTVTTKDDARFANELVARLKDLTDDPALSALVCERAYAMGSRDPDGYRAAIEAAKRLSSDSAGAGGTREWRPRLTELYQLQFKRATGAERAECGEALLGNLNSQAGEEADAANVGAAQRGLADAAAVARQIASPRLEEVRTLTRDLQNRAAALERVTKLKARFDANPSDAALLGQLLDAYMLDLDAPALAAPLAGLHPDAAVRSMVPLAAQRPEELTPDQWLQLGGWFRALAQRARPEERAAPLLRAADYLMRFLAGHDKQDGQRLQAQRDLDVVLKELPAVPGAKVVRMVVWNTYNANYKDRGTTAFNVVLYSGDRVVWRRDGVRLEWRPDADTSATVYAPAVPFDRVRVEVTAVHGRGGGLSEIEVYRGGRNIALGAATAASGTFQNNPDLAPARLTDGVTSSARTGGYWALPDGPGGWADVYVYRTGRPPQ